MSQVGDLIGTQRAPAASMIGPAEDTGLEEGAIDNELTAALEQIEQANPTVWPVELVLLLDGHPRHPSALGGQRIASAGQLLLHNKQLLARSFPLLRRNDRRRVLWERSSRVIHVFLGGCCHFTSPMFSDAERDH